MGQDSAIEWTDATWNPLRGCSRISEGCRNCYAERVAARFSGHGMAYDGLAKMTPSGPRWTGKLARVEEHLFDPVRWTRPRRIFVNSMSDLFHESVEEWWINEIFAVMALASWHTFQVLTKRPGIMLKYLSDPATQERIRSVMRFMVDDLVDPNNRKRADLRATAPNLCPDSPDWPLRNVWLGASVEDQATADERIPALMNVPARMRFLSCEPLLDSVDLSAHLRQVLVGIDLDKYGVFTNGAIGCPGKVIEAAPLIKWVIVGGESGPGARAIDANWIRSIVRQCREGGVSVFVKQMGANVHDRNDAGFDGHEPTAWPDGTETDDWHLDPSRQFQGADARILLRDKKGGDPAEWPEDLRIREFPNINPKETA